MYIFWHTIILAVVNDWLLYKQDCKALKMSSKETMNRRQFQAKLASSLILVNTALQTPKRGRPSSGKGSPTVTSGSPLNDQKRPSKRSAQLPLDVLKDLVRISQWRQGEKAADTALKDTLKHNAASVMFVCASQRTRTVSGTLTMNESQPWKGTQKNEDVSRKSCLFIYLFIFSS